MTPVSRPHVANKVDTIKVRIGGGSYSIDVYKTPKGGIRFRPYQLAEVFSNGATDKFYYDKKKSAVQPCAFDDCKLHYGVDAINLRKFAKINLPVCYQSIHVASALKQIRKGIKRYEKPKANAEIKLNLPTVRHDVEPKELKFSDPVPFGHEIVGLKIVPPAEVIVAKPSRFTFVGALLNFFNK